MAKFLVPTEMAPGVARHAVGFFEPGQVMGWPDAATKRDEKPSLKLVPLDQEAYDILVKCYSAARVAEKHGPGPLAPEAKDPVGDGTKTVAQLVAEKGEAGGKLPDAPSGKSKRQADR